MKCHGIEELNRSTCHGEASMDNWDMFMVYINDVSLALATNKRKSYGLRLAGEEILSNLIRHAEPDAPTQTKVSLWLSCWHELSEDGQAKVCVLQFQDDAKPYDPRLESRATKPPMLDAPPHDRAIGGLGLFLAIANVDSIVYSRQGIRNQYQLRVAG